VRLRALRSDLLHHGRVVKRAGDGTLIEFRSVADAVRCANRGSEHRWLNDELAATRTLSACRQVLNQSSRLVLHPQEAPHQ
jgi:class 3 adenylate cyclase